MNYPILKTIENQLVKRNINSFFFLLLLIVFSIADLNPNSISNMPPGNIFEIEMHSQGCFHHDSFIIQIEKLPQARLDSCAVLRIKNNSLYGQIKSNVEMVLPINAIISLDGWIQYYRTEPEGACITRDTLIFRWLSGQDTIVSETYKDYSCADFLDDGFTFWRAISIAETCCKKPGKKICKMYKVECEK